MNAILLPDTNFVRQPSGQISMPFLSSSSQQAIRSGTPMAKWSRSVGTLSS